MRRSFRGARLHLPAFSRRPNIQRPVSEINIAGLPGVTTPAGRYGNGAPFSLIFIGGMWSEADLLGLAYGYEQATHHRIVPELAETPYSA